MINDTLNEQIEKFKLYSNYTSSRTLDENIENIFEQYSSPEEKIYYTLARAVGGPGTNIKLLKQAFNEFKDGQQLLAVEKMMSEKPMYGYSTIPSLLRGELGQDNQMDFVELQKMVAPKGINLKADTQKSASGAPFVNMRTIKVSIGSAIQNKPVTANVASPSGATSAVATTSAGKKQSTANPTITFKPNENFPIKFMDSGEKVKQLQTALNVMNKAGQANITGKFYTTTEQKLINKMNELGLTYDRKMGVDEKTFNLIMNQNNSKGNQVTPVSQVGVDTKNVDLNPQTELPKNISAEPTAKVTGTSPQQYYEKLVSMNYVDPVGANRIVYRGPRPDKNVLDSINSYLQTQGYTQTRERSPKNRDKQIVVWKK